MGAAALLYEGDVRDTAAIITALSTKAASTLLVIPVGNGTGCLIFEQGS